MYDFPFVADCVKNAAKDPIDLNEKWISIHCRISQYLLQIVPCKDSKYCGDFSATWKSVLSSHFLPAPVPVRQILERPAVPRQVIILLTFGNIWTFSS